MNNQAKPNIVMIVMDTVRADHCSAWGYHRQTTPFLSDLAEKSTVFTNVISPSSWTLPAHISMFTGLYPSQHGTLTEENRMHPKIELLAEILRKNGYNTAGFSNNPWVSSIRGLEKGFITFQEIFRGHRKQEKGQIRLNIDRFRHFFFLEDNGAERTNKKISRWLNEYKLENNNQPLFLFINYMDAHQVYNPQRPFHKLFSGGLNSYLEMLQNRNIARNKAEIFAGEKHVPDHAYQVMQNMYDRAIAYLDYRISELIQFLDKKLDPENTLLIITSDHGDNFGEHTRHGIKLIGHLFSLHQSLLHVPLLIRYPGVFSEGSIQNGLVQHNDIFHTIMDIVGTSTVNQKSDLDINLLSGAKRKYAIAEYETPPIQLERFRKDYPAGNFQPFNVSLRTIQDKRYKLLLGDSKREGLFDIKNDPLEKNNLINSQKEVETDLFRSLNQWLTDTPRQDSSQTSEMNLLEDEQLRNRLEDLGYL